MFLIPQRKERVPNGVSVTEYGSFHSLSQQSGDNINSAPTYYPITAGNRLYSGAAAQQSSFEGYTYLLLMAYEGTGNIVLNDDAYVAIWTSRLPDPTVRVDLLGQVYHNTGSVGYCLAMYRVRVLPGHAASGMVAATLASGSVTCITCNQIRNPIDNFADEGFPSDIKIFNHGDVKTWDRNVNIAKVHLSYGGYMIHSRSMVEANSKCTGEVAADWDGNVVHYGDFLNSDLINTTLCRAYRSVSTGSYNLENFAREQISFAWSSPTNNGIGIHAIFK